MDHIARHALVRPPHPHRVGPDLARRHSVALAAIVLGARRAWTVQRSATFVVQRVSRADGQVGHPAKELARPGRSRSAGWAIAADLEDTLPQEAAILFSDTAADDSTPSLAAKLASLAPTPPLALVVRPLVLVLPNPTETVLRPIQPSAPSAPVRTAADVAQRSEHLSRQGKEWFDRDSLQGRGLAPAGRVRRRLDREGVLCLLSLWSVDA